MVNFENNACYKNNFLLSIDISLYFLILFFRLDFPVEFEEEVVLYYIPISAAS